MLRVGPDRAKIAAMVNPSTPSTTWRHTLGLLLAVGVAWSVASNPVAALVAVVAVQLLIALLERLPGLRRSPRRTCAAPAARRRLRARDGACKVTPARRLSSAGERE